MKTMTAADITKKQFNRFRLVQYGGKYNMMADAGRAMRRADLTQSQYMAIIEHYDELETKYGPYGDKK